MTSLGLEITAFAMRFAAGLCAIAAIAGAALVFGLRGLTWWVVAVLLIGTLAGSLLIVLEDRVMWRARKELMREEAALR